jgi:hypothetical protein
MSEKPYQEVAQGSRVTTYVPGSELAGVNPSLALIFLKRLPTQKIAK